MATTIFTIYEKHNRYLNTYKPEDMTPAIIKTRVGLNVRHYVFMKTDKYPKGIYLDISLIFQEQPIGQVSTWEDFALQLTDMLVDSYKLSGAGLSSSNDGTFKQALNIHPYGTAEFSVGYCDMRDPTLVNNKARRFDMPDLVISKNKDMVTSLKDINFDNCITSVNGVISRSVVYNNNLYVVNGAKHLWDINKNNSINIFTTDLTPLGGVVAVPLSKCTIKYQISTRYDEAHQPDPLYSNVKIILPVEYNLNNYTPLLVIAGKCQFPDEIAIENTRTIRIEPYRMNIPLRLLQIYQSSAEYTTSTDVVPTQITASQYINTLGQTDMSAIYDMVYLIKDPKVFVRREYVAPEIGWLSKCTKSTPGICIRTSDGSWMTNATIEYNEKYYHFGVRWPHDTTILTEPSEKQQYGTKEVNCIHADKFFRDLRSGIYEMVYLTR